MSSGPRERRPIKVVILVVGLWVVGRLLQAGLTSLVAGTSGFSPEAAEWAAIIVAWGFLCAVSYALRERLDDWLRA
jgi:hypothetical protein